jgi:diguanylate cyclase (GGDEF)-like protein
MPYPSTSLSAQRDDSDELVFLEETPAPIRKVADQVWRVMIVDDDQDVHVTTTFALGNLDMQGRPLEFVHAYSAAEARALLERERDIAVILLDVVMEQEDAGLHLVRHIRETLKLLDVRIILRTGQPGYAPEIEAIRDYEINDYKTKSELTRTKLFTSVTAAIRSYEQIRALNGSRHGLDQIVRASTELMALHGIGDFASGVMQQIAGMLGSPPNGVLCVEEPVHCLRPELKVVACAGQFQARPGTCVSVLGAPQVAAALDSALFQRRSSFQQDHIALYFTGKAKRNFVAYLTPGRQLSEMEQRLLEVFCSNVAVGLDNVELVADLHKAAFFDQLSRLPNRTRLVELLDAALACPDSAGATLALIDLDHFAAINDALGHQFGDLLLVAVAERLQRQLGDQVTVARTGGDIFAMLGTGRLVNPDSLLDLFEPAFSIDGQDVQVTATLGLVRLAEHDGNGADALKDADIALKRAKSQQRAGHCYFSRSMGIEIRERVRMMHALRSAFHRRELFLAYQPQIDLDTRRTVGAEALLRWRTPDGKLVPPDRFIPIAEYSGLIIQIGEWVLKSACAELVRLRAEGHHDFTLSVNVSQVQFRHPHFLDMLRAALAESGAPPQYLELEITESMAMEEPELLIDKLAIIKQTGVAIAIDDFGTGFSSLSHLQRLRVDRLKIDRAFVSEITASARGSSIAEMIIQLGRNLGLSIIAEGVEDERQAETLLGLGCPLAQGFLFARPLEAEALRGWLAQLRAP